jgi:hypothetical protein
LSGYIGNIVHWESSIDNGLNWIPININSNTFDYNNLISDTRFRALVQNGPCSFKYSNEVSIHVNPISTPGQLFSSDTLVCESYNSGIIQLSGNTGTIMHWEYSEDNGKNWNVINHTSNSYSFNNLLKQTLFRVLVQNGICSSAYSNNVTITINQATIAGKITGSSIVCQNTK